MEEGTPATAMDSNQGRDDVGLGQNSSRRCRERCLAGWHLPRGLSLDHLPIVECSCRKQANKHVGNEHMAGGGKALTSGNVHTKEAPECFGTKCAENPTAINPFR